jgi:uncharacterized protein YqeY
MSIMQQIQNDINLARRAKDSQMLKILTTLYAEAAKPGKTNRNGESTEAEVTKVLKYFKDNATDMLKIKGSSTELDLEISVYSKYIPVVELISDVQLTQIIEELIQNTPLDVKSKMGWIMSELKTLYNGRYDGKVANTIINQLLK